MPILQDFTETSSRLAKGEVQSFSTVWFSLTRNCSASGGVYTAYQVGSNSE